MPGQYLHRQVFPSRSLPFKALQLQFAIVPTIGLRPPDSLPLRCGQEIEEADDRATVCSVQQTYIFSCTSQHDRALDLSKRNIAGQEKGGRFLVRRTKAHWWSRPRLIRGPPHLASSWLCWHRRLDTNHNALIVYARCIQRTHAPCGAIPFAVRRPPFRSVLSVNSCNHARKVGRN
jgi:hypothetical protein